MPARRSLSHSATLALASTRWLRQRRYTAPMPRTIELYPFRYRDPLTGKWIRGRYLAERHELEQRYREWEITGPPGIRHVPDDPLALSAAHVSRNSTGQS